MHESTTGGRKDRRTDATTVGDPQDNGESSAKSDAVHSPIREIDREIAELKEERDRIQKLLDDPLERRKRRERREQQIGRMVAPIARLNTAKLQKLREVFPEETWIWDEAVLRADGWVLYDGEWAIGRRRNRPAGNSSG